MNENLSTRFAQILGVVGLLVTLVSGLLLLQKRMTSENGVVSNMQASTHVSANADTSNPLSKTKTATRPIEDLRVGDRVMAYNPEVTEAERSSWKKPDWENWIKLTLLMTKPDGSELKIQMLRSEEWVMSQLGFVVDRADPTGRAGSHRPEKVDQTSEETGLVKTGLQPDTSTESGPSQVPLSPVRPVFRHLAIMSALFDVYGSDSGIELLGLTIQMDLHELGLTGKAIVLDIEACPPVRSGEGRVVTATFHHNSGDVIDLVVADEIDQGEHETIGTTSNHPFWSVDRQEYVQAGSLRKGEHLRTIHGDTKRVISKLARPGPEPVYNLEVFGEHTYFVGKDGILVHNNGPQYIEFNSGLNRWRNIKTKQIVKKPGTNDVMLDTGVLRNFVAEGSAMRHIQKSAVNGRRMLVTQKAVDEFREAIMRTGTISEKLRANKLLAKLTVVPDSPSPAFQIASSRRLGADDLKIFGTADNLGVEILSTDRTFMRTYFRRTGTPINGQWFSPY